MKANLFIIGAMKAGTTTLHYLLDRHPDIFMSLEKEPQVFSSKPLASYDDIFEGYDKQKYMGESSTAYTKLPDEPNIAKQIYDYNPDAKLIYLIREPMARAVSHYRHNIFMYNRL